MHDPNTSANLAKMPPMCYAVHFATGDTVVLIKGERGYRDPGYGVQGEDVVNGLNAEMGVSRQQRAAMEAGSVLGYHMPGADPDNYDESGRSRPRT